MINFHPRISTMTHFLKLMSWIVGGIVVAGVLVTLALRHPSTATSQRTVNHAPMASRATLLHVAAKVPPHVNEGAITLTPSAVANYRDSFAKARSYWKFARDALADANAGNADAQFYLSRVLEYCAENNRFYFQRRGKSIGLDEAIQYAAQRNLPIDVAQQVYDRCHEFAENDPSQLGKSSDWLAQATASGQPLAEATTATQLLMQDARRNMARANGGLTNAATEIIEGDPRELLREAIQSKDPEVLFSVGDAIALMASSNRDSDTARYAWWLVVCQRGLDCSSTAEWVRNSCVNSPICASASGPSDLVQIFAGDKWPDVEQKARDINTDLDQGNWSGLGLGF